MNNQGVGNNFPMNFGIPPPPNNAPVSKDFRNQLLPQNFMPQMPQFPPNMNMMPPMTIPPQMNMIPPMNMVPPMTNIPPPPMNSMSLPPMNIPPPPMNSMPPPPMGSMPPMNLTNNFFQPYGNNSFKPDNQHGGSGGNRNDGSGGNRYDGSGGNRHDGSGGARGRGWRNADTARNQGGGRGRPRPQQRPKRIEKDDSDSSSDSEDDAIDRKRKSNLVPLDAFFSPADGSSNGSADTVEKSSKKKKDDDTSHLSTDTKDATGKVNAKSDKTGVKEELEEGEIGDLEEGELRELEEGELPEDIEKIDANRDMSVITKSIPIDFDDFNRKRKVALLLSYCGAGFHGMQKNPEVETIELRLMEALAAIRAIRPDLKNEFLNNNNNQLSFNRAARTDKGVSAARQVVSLKLIANENFLVEVNKNLPKEIRVFGIERVTKTFDAKLSCSGRCYEYLVPTVAFAPSKEIMDSTYRLSDEHLEKVSGILKKYVGTHNFHNFTSGKRFSDKSAIRYITAFMAGKPFECRGHEFISLEVQGQSFLIHQIRKMIGLCMAICRGYCGEDTVGKSWLERKLDIPKAPGLGLLLNRLNFKAYDQKYGSDGRHNPLTWEYCELEVERYKIEYLWHTIIEEEIKKSSLIHWLKTLNNHTYTEAGMNAPMNSDYKGKKGVFPSLRDKRRYNVHAHKEGALYDPRRDGAPNQQQQQPQEPTQQQQQQPQQEQPPPPPPPPFPPQHL